MLFIGAVSYTEARTDLVQIIEANGMTAANEASESDSESSADEKDEDELVQLDKTKYGKYTSDKGIIDATTPGKGQCEPRLWEALPEINW
jgi:hypothetical protein